MHWRVKGLIQKALSYVPAGGRVNDWLQLRVGGLKAFDETVDSKVIDDWLVFSSHMRTMGVLPAGLDCVEVGTGWFPTLPMCFSLAGVRSCRTYDVNHLLNEKLTLQMVRRLERHLDAISEASGRSPEDVRSDYAALRRCTTVVDLLCQARVQYLVKDAALSGLPHQSVDLIFSNSVLEHVPRHDISRILVENRRILKEDGHVIHSINCGDHYAYVDKHITPINYLTYSDSQWRFWNNSFLYQNRLRPSDFQALVEGAGMEIAVLKFTPRPELVARVSRLRLAPQFRSYPLEQLCATSVDVVARF